MATCTLTLDVGLGPDTPAAKGHMKIARVTRGSNGTMIVVAGLQPVPFMYPFATVVLQQGVDYQFVEDIPGGQTRYCTIPATSTANYRSLTDITPLPPSPPLSADALIASLIPGPSATGTALDTKTGAAIDAVTTNDIIATSTAGALARGKWTRVDATAGTKAMTLANAVAARQVTIVEKSDASVNTVTIALGLRGSAGTLTLDSQFQTFVLVADDDLNWYVQSDHRTKAAIAAMIAAQSLVDDGKYVAISSFVPTVQGISLVNSLIFGGN